MWKNYIELLSQKNRVITIDLLGHGKSECLGYIHSMEDQADMVHAVLLELKIRKAVLVGHSMGGYVALAFAELYPNIVKGLILLNSTSRADSDERKLNRERAIKAVKQNYTAFVRMSIANLFSEDNRERLTDEIEKVKKEALENSFTRDCCRFRRYESSKRSRSFTAFFALSYAVNFRKKRWCFEL